MTAVAIKDSPPSYSARQNGCKKAKEDVVEYDDYKRRWELYWASDDSNKQAMTQTGPSLALQELLEDHRWLLPRGRCLVSGCGSGHDALYLAQRGVLSVLGIDFCEQAIAKAQKQQQLSDYANVLFVADNFFFLTAATRFTVAFEFGLFSSIAPSQRQQWAETYARIIVPQGSLVLVLTPLIHRSSSPEQSTPFIHAVSMAECERYLKRYFVLVRADPNSWCSEGNEGNELLCVWKRL